MRRLPAKRCAAILRRICLKPGAPERPLAVAARMAFASMSASILQPCLRTARSHQRNNKRSPRASSTPACSIIFARIENTSTKCRLWIRR